MVAHRAGYPKYTSVCPMKPILVHVHVYYTELWKELESCLHNLVAYPCEIYVTYVKDDAAFEAQVRAFGHDVKLVKVENRGFDVAPFLEILRRVNLKDYSYVAKLHTKRNVSDKVVWPIYFTNICGPNWRKYLLAPFSSARALRRCIRRLKKRPNLGMLAHHLLILNESHDTHMLAAQEAAALCTEYSIPMDEKKKVFVAGTMFLCRAEAFLPIANFARQRNLAFGEVHPRHDAADLAHQLERIFGWSVMGQGYEIADVFSPWYMWACSYLRIVRHFIIHYRTRRRILLFGFISLPLPWVRKESLYEK